MSWPPRQPLREEIAPEDRSAYDFVIERARTNQQKPNPETDAGYYGRLMLSPQLGCKISEIGRLTRLLGERDDSYSHADREFVDQVLAVDMRTNVVQILHVRDAISTGVRIEAIEALREGREQDLTDDEKQLADFIRKVVAGEMDGETWTAMETRMGERATVEYTIFILFLQLTMRLQSAVGFPNPPDSVIDRILAEIKSGERVVEDFRTRIS